MWEWLGAQAQSAGPFVAVFCLFACGILVVVIKLLWNQHLLDIELIREIANKSTEANTAVALALEKSASTLAIPIATLTARFDGWRK